MASIHFDASWLDAMDQFVDDLHDHVYNRVHDIASTMQESLVEDAKKQERWSSLSEHIDLWDEHGFLHLGVRNKDFVSEAFEAEYGDREIPPSPLLRPFAQNAQALVNNKMRGVHNQRVPIHAAPAVRRNAR